MNEGALFDRLDKIIVLLELSGRRPSLISRILNGMATFIGILGVLSIVDLIATWIGG